MSDLAASENKLTIRHYISSRFFWGGLAILVAIGSLVTLITLMVKSGETADQTLTQSVMPVKVITAQTVTSVDYVRTLTGVIRARRRSELAFERAARITKVNVDDGDPVIENQVLAELDTRDLVIAENKVNAEIEKAKAVLAELTAGPRQQVIESAKADAAALLAELHLAEEIKQRRETLKQTGAISDEEWENATTRLKAAVARHASAEQKLKELEAGTRQEQKDAQAAVLKQLQAQLAQVKLDIGKSLLRAPFNGRVAGRYLDEGVVVSPGRAVLKITETESLEAVVGIPPTSLDTIRQTSSFPCVVGNISTTAQLLRILPETDPVTRTIPVVFRLKTSAAKPGQIFRLKIKEKRTKRGIWVPTAALIPSSKGLWSLFIVKRSDSQSGTSHSTETEAESLRTEMRPVEVIFNDGNRSLVRGPISDGEQIVCEGAQRINDGQLVSIASSD